KRDKFLIITAKLSTNNHHATAVKFHQSRHKVTATKFSTNARNFSPNFRGKYRQISPPHQHINANLVCNRL
ncbi:MAG: hypothetical protein ACTTIM_06470, partial [Campylobacter sp.]